MKTILALSLAASLVLPTTLLAQKKTTTKAPAEMALKINQAQSNVKWTGFKKTGSSHNGSVTIKEGQIKMVDGLVTAGNLLLDMQSITVLDIPATDSMNAKLTGHLKDADFFDVAKHNTAQLVIKSSKKTADQIEVMGDLTIRGKTQPVTIPVTVSQTGKTVKATGSLKIDRTQFGIQYASANFFKLAADKIIEDQFELSFDLVAE